MIILSSYEFRLLVTFWVASIVCWQGTQYQALFYVILCATGAISSDGWYVITLMLIVVQFINLLMRAVKEHGS